MSLRTGTEMISLTMLFNKVTGFYGLLAILTGLHLSPVQLSMYLYSIAALALTALLMPHIRKQSPFECLALAWFYILDTAVNTAYTAIFAITWFLTVSADHNNNGTPSAPGSGTIDDTAGFTNPKYNVSQVDVVAAPAAGVAAGQDAVAVGTAAAAVAASGSPTLGHGVTLAESLPSIFLIVLLSLVRVYFILVVMSFARQVLRQHMYITPSPRLHLHVDGSNEDKADALFDQSKPQYQGWKGKLGRMMLNTGRSYWVGGHVDNEWARGLDNRFKGQRSQEGPPGTIERERRARSGTGPPMPAPGLTKM